MRTVNDILARKGNLVVKVEPTTAVIRALEIMAEKNIGSVVVMDGTKFLGIMTERDYSRKVVLKGRSSDHTTVADIMSSDFPEVASNAKIEYCMKLLSENKLRYLPVIENNNLTGIVSMTDVVAETIIGQQEMISHLQNYLQS